MRLHLIVFIYGFTAVLGNLITLNALSLVFHRMWIAALAIFIFLAATKRTDFKSGKNAGRILLAGVIIAAHWITFFHSIKISTVSVTLACVSTGAFFGSLLEPIFFKRKMKKIEILLGLMVMIGLYIIFQFEGDYFWGILTALLSAFLSALFSVINGVLIKGNTPYRITFLEMLGGCLSIALYLIFTGKFNASMFIISSSDWLYLLILGVICTGYAFLESVTLMKHISPFTLLLAINLEPIYGIILAFIFFDEYDKMTPYFFLGASIILSTVFIDAIVRRKERKHKANADVYSLN